MTTTQVELTPEAQILLEEVATFQSRSPKAIVQRAIEKYLRDESEEMRFFHECEAGYQASKQTGEFSTLADLKAWIDKLDSDEEYELPKTRRVTPWQD